MKKLYKNLTEKEINMNLFGMGKIIIPVGVSEIEEKVVRAIQGMTPVKVFEGFVEEELIPKSLEEMTNKELRAMCAEQGIEASDRDTKAILISKLRGE